MQRVKDLPVDPEYRVVLFVNGENMFDDRDSEDFEEAEKKFQKEKRMIASDAGVFYATGDLLELRLETGATGDDGEWFPAGKPDLLYSVTI